MIAWWPRAALKVAPSLHPGCVSGQKDHSRRIGFERQIACSRHHHTLSRLMPRVVCSLQITNLSGSGNTDCQQCESATGGWPRRSRVAGVRVAFHPVRDTIRCVSTYCGPFWPTMAADSEDGQHGPRQETWATSPDVLEVSGRAVTPGPTPEEQSSRSRKVLGCHCDCAALECNQDAALTKIDPQTTEPTGEGIVAARPRRIGLHVVGGVRLER